MKYCFNKNIKIINFNGIMMIGNPVNGVLLGLDNEGFELVNDIWHGKDVTVKSDTQEELLSELHQSEFFEGMLNNVMSSAYFHVTSKCNLHCVGCYSDEKDRNSKIDLTTEQCYKILDNLRSSGVEQVVISGGEPLLRGDLEDILKYAKHVCKFDAIQVVSNGMVECTRYDSILQYIDVISISVDGYNDKTHFLRDSNMKHVLNVVKYLSKSTTKLNMIFTINAKNLGCLDKYVELSCRLHVPFTFSILTVKNDEAYEGYYLTDSDYEYMNTVFGNSTLPLEDSPYTGSIGCRTSCGLGMKIVSISSSGDIYPCHMLHEEELKMGNALLDKVSDCAKSFWDVDMIKECITCECKHICGGGCFARRYFNNKKIADSCDMCCVLYNKGIKQTLDEMLTQ